MAHDNERTEQSPRDPHFRWTGARTDYKRTPRTTAETLALVNDPTWRRATGRIPIENPFPDPRDAPTALSYDAGCSLTLAQRIVAMEFIINVGVSQELWERLFAAESALTEMKAKMAVLERIVHTLDACRPETKT